MFTQWNKAFEKSVLDCYEPNIGLFLGGADSTAIALCLADHKLPFLSVTCLNNQKAEDLLMGAPSKPNELQLKELNIKVLEKKK